MMIIMTLLVRDEQDIIATNIDYHLSQGIDKIIITDNLSVDNTANILNEYAKAGVIQVIKEYSDDYSQHKWVTHMAKLAVEEYNADWVIHCDADEFWIPDNRSHTIKQVLTQLPNTEVAGSAKRVNFLPPIATDEQQYFANSMTLRETISYNAIGQPLPPKVCHRGIQNITIKQGNHHVQINKKRITPIELPITIYHFPLRSYSQFKNKIKLGGAAYERNTHLDKNIGSTWRHLYKQYLEGKLEDHYRTQRPDNTSILKLIEKQRLINDQYLLNYITQNLNYKKLSKQYGNK